MRFSLASVVVFLQLSAAGVALQVPQSTSPPTLIRMSGTLVTPTGEARTSPVVLIASLYAGPQDVMPVWVEQQVVTLDQAGRYTMLVGITRNEGVPQELFLSGAARWLGVAVQGEPEQPRLMLVSAPYTVKALEAESLSGRSVADFVLAENLNASVKSALKEEGVSSVNSKTPLIASTTNALAKFTDTGGTIGDSAVVDVSGNIGIGTSSPGYRLEVAGTSASGEDIVVKGGGTDIGIAASNTGAGGREWRLLSSNNNSGNGGGKFIIWDANAGYPAGNRFAIDSSGNVGIGTASPGYRLEVTGSSSSGEDIVVKGNGTDIGMAVYNTGGGGREWRLLSSNDSSGNGGGKFIIWDANAGYPTGNRFAIDSSGNVGIGTTSPTSKLDVAGSINVSGNINAKYQDVAEWVDAPAPLEPGTVVIVDPSAPNRVVPASTAYDTRVAGAVSERPGLALGERSDTKVLVAQSGRVRIKVDARYGAIQIGDLLVTSPTPGRAMRSQPMKVSGQTLHRPGTLLGKALEPLPGGQGEILVLLTLQ